MNSAEFRATIDPITNVISPRGLVLGRDFGSLIQPPWPDAAASPFLHELTHHWCLNSPLGTTLAFLRFRMMRAMSTNFGRVPFEDVFDSVIARYTVDSMLTAIGEGLALFAEFDMLPGESSVVSEPMTWATTFLTENQTHGQESHAANIFTLVSQRLLEIRLAAATVERKVDCLIDPNSKDDRLYLDGYLTIKRVRAELGKRYSLCRDADFFLTYMRNYVYCDFGLVSVLTDEFLNPFDRQERIIARINERIDHLLSADLSKAMEAFNVWTGNRRGALDENELPPGLELSEDETRSGEDGLKRLRDELIADSKIESSAQLAEVQLSWLARRSIVQLASESARVRVKDGVPAVFLPYQQSALPFLTGGAKALVPLSDSIKDTEDSDGWITIALIPWSHTRVLVIGIDNNPVAYAWIGGVDILAHLDSNIKDVIRTAVSAPVVLASERRLNSSLDAEFRSGLTEKGRGGLEKQMRRAGDAARRLLDSVIDRWCESGEVSFSNRTRKDGIWCLANGDVNALRQMVTLGMLYDCDTNAPDLRERLKSADIDLVSCRKHVMELRQSIGGDFMRSEGGRDRWLI